jgi:hypothetical protein
MQTTCYKLELVTKRHFYNIHEYKTPLLNLSLVIALPSTLVYCMMCLAVHGVSVQFIDDLLICVTKPGIHLKDFREKLSVEFIVRPAAGNWRKLRVPMMTRACHFRVGLWHRAIPLFSFSFPSSPPSPN